MKVTRLLALSLLLSALAAAQAPSPEPDRKTPAVPTVKFELNWREGDPRWYSLSVDSMGNASYQSEPQQGNGEVAGDPWMYKFEASKATRDRIFELTKKLNYFQGDFDFKGGNIANTGTKTLTWATEGHQYHTTYNWSENPQVLELTGIFQKMSNTFEYARKLQFTMRFDKLGLDADLKSMEQASQRGALLEVQAIEPLLRQILNDRGSMNITRQRINHILGQK